MSVFCNFSDQEVQSLELKNFVSTDQCLCETVLTCFVLTLLLLLAFFLSLISSFSMYPESLLCLSRLLCVDICISIADICFFYFQLSYLFLIAGTKQD